MNFLSITAADPMWAEVSRFARNCSWSAGKSLSQNMSDNIFTDWERVIAAIHENEIAGYCTVARQDCIPDVPYTPYIGYMFVAEKYRGHRLSQKLISYAMSYLRTLGFHEVFLVSDHENLYEKYDFKVIDQRLAPWGAMEKIYRREIKGLMT
ncbi:MAG: GNAT family N-acetyltransferase [Eubacterium sp.]|nr:GNAT family N-acetyltransferase [Eubacterium sp.]